MSREGKRALAERPEQGFYRGDLELEKEPQNEEAFGYTWSAIGSVLKCRGQNKFEVEDPSDNKRKGIPLLSGPEHYMTEKRQQGVIQGRLVRMLDMTNESESSVKEQVVRLVFELRSAGYARHVILKALRRVEVDAWCSLKDAKSAATLQPKSAKVCAIASDWVRKVVAQVERVDKR